MYLIHSYGDLTLILCLSIDFGISMFNLVLNIDDCSVIFVFIATVRFP